MDYKTFCDMDEKFKKFYMSLCLENRGECISIESGLCGDIYILDLGKEHGSSRYICAKTPRLNKSNPIENNKRFINELEKQLTFFGHSFVHWASEFKIIMDMPVALFRYWGSDLKKLIHENSSSEIQKLSILIYTAVGLRYCYNKGLLSHQDLKPSNIFLKDLKKSQSGLEDLDIFTHALIADFGLANAFKDSNVFDGSRPYMAPEQWEELELSPATDIFALGIILFELMSGGYHPAINNDKLEFFWPKEQEGYSKKWTRKENWIKWIENNCPINNTHHNIPTSILELIKNMISKEVSLRPSIDVVIDKLLEEIRLRCEKSYKSLVFYINYHDNNPRKSNLKENWPSLEREWTILKNRFTQN
ncbi:protein kinase domain-containing protein [Aliarcobacter butzleri]